MLSPHPDSSGRRAALQNSHCWLWAGLHFVFKEFKILTEMEQVRLVCNSNHFSLNFMFQIGECNPHLQKVTDILDSIKEKVKLIPGGW